MTRHAARVALFVTAVAVGACVEIATGPNGAVSIRVAPAQRAIVLGDTLRDFHAVLVEVAAAGDRRNRQDRMQRRRRRDRARREHGGDGQRNCTQPVDMQTGKGAHGRLARSDYKKMIGARTRGDIGRNA